MYTYKIHELIPDSEPAESKYHGEMTFPVPLTLSDQLDLSHLFEDGEVHWARIDVIVVTPTFHRDQPVGLDWQRQPTPSLPIVYVNFD